MRKTDSFKHKATNFLLKNSYQRDCLFPARQTENLIVKMRDLNFVKSCKNKGKFLLSLFGGVIGLVNGFFGGGGGMICVPTLQKVAHLNQKQSHASAIFVILPLSVVSSVVYFFNGYVEIFPLLSVGIGVVVGGIIGALLLKNLSSKTIQVIFVVIMLVAGVRLII